MDIKRVFELINDKNVKYVILRNWELFYDDLLIDGHNDIDLLCKTNHDKHRLIKAFGAKTNYDKYDSKYYFFFNDKKIFLDIKVVGDGYYCKKWERKMINNKINNKLGFFVLDDENYLFSLIYHFLIHKKNISDNYKETVERLSKKLNLTINDYKDALVNYMKAKNYFFSIPYDNNVGKNYVKCDISVKREFSVFLLNILLKIKSMIYH